MDLCFPALRRRENYNVSSLSASGKQLRHVDLKILNAEVLWTSASRRSVAGKTIMFQVFVPLLTYRSGHIQIRLRSCSIVQNFRLQGVGLEDLTYGKLYSILELKYREYGEE